MAQIASLLVPGVNIPQPDNSWLSGIADSIGGAIQNVRTARSFNGLADRLQGGAAAPTQQSSGFLSSLTGGAQTAPAAATSPRYSAGGPVDPAIKDGIIKTANSLGISPVDLATAISYETGGTYDPTKRGPTTQWGQHRGLIQFGEPQAQQYGVDWNDPVGSQLGENGAVANYLRSTGVKPGMGMMDIYSAINAGGVGRYDRSDANNGGAPGTVADKVNNQMAGHRARAQALFGDAVAAAPATAADAVSAMGDGSLATAYTGEAPPRQQAPMQVADSSPSSGMIAQGITPVQRGSVDPSIIQYMLRDRNLREEGLKLWAANAGGQRADEPWQFVNLPDGTLARANQQTGAVERLGNFAKQPGQGGGKFGLNPQYGTDAQGNPVLLQIGEDGTATQTKLPDGVSLSKEPIRLDAGTNFILLDPITRQQVGVIPKENRQEAFDKAIGGAEGKAVGESNLQLPQTIATAEEGLRNIDAVINDPNLGAAVGVGGILPAIPGTSQAGTVARIEQLQGQAFLQAFESLKGGGQITEVEGKKATDAIARLNRAQNKEDFVTSLSELRSIVQSGLDRARKKGSAPEVSAPSASSAPGAIARPMTDADYNAIPSGALFVDPDDGKTYRKP